MSRLILKYCSQRALIYLVMVMSVLMSACTSPEASTLEPTLQIATSEAVGTGVAPRGTPTATLPAPSFREPREPITLDNITEIAYLGRLEPPGSKGTVFEWTISPDGTQLAGLNNDQLMEWNLVSGELNFSTARRQISHIFYSADKNEIYGIQPDGLLYIYRSITGDPLTTLTPHENYRAINAYHNDTGLLAVPGTDQTIKVWDVKERVSLVTFETDLSNIIELEFSSDGTRLAIYGYEQPIQLWDWREKTLLSEFDLQDATALSLAFSPDDSQLAAATKNFVAVWDVVADKLDYVLQTGSDTADEILEFSPDGQFLLTAGEEGNMRLWDTATSDLKIELPDIGGIRVGGTFSPDSTLLSTSLLGGRASLWNLTDITERSVANAPLDVQSDNLFGVEWSSDGYTLLFFDASGDVHVWGIPPSTN